MNKLYLLTYMNIKNTIFYLTTYNLDYKASCYLFIIPSIYLYICYHFTDTTTRTLIRDARKTVQNFFGSKLFQNFFKISKLCKRSRANLLVVFQLKYKSE